MAKKTPKTQQVAVPKPLWKKIRVAAKKFDPPATGQWAVTKACEEWLEANK